MSWKLSSRFALSLTLMVSLSTTFSASYAQAQTGKQEYTAPDVSDDTETVKVPSPALPALVIPSMNFTINPVQPKAAAPVQPETRVETPSLPAAAAAAPAITRPPQAPEEPTLIQVRIETRQGDPIHLREAPTSHGAGAIKGIIEDHTLLTIDTEALFEALSSTRVSDETRENFFKNQNCSDLHGILKKVLTEKRIKDAGDNNRHSFLKVSYVNRRGKVEKGYVATEFLAYDNKNLKWSCQDLYRSVLSHSTRTAATCKLQCVWDSWKSTDLMQQIAEPLSRLIDPNNQDDESITDNLVKQVDEICPNTTGIQSTPSYDSAETLPMAAPPVRIAPVEVERMRIRALPDPVAEDTAESIPAHPELSNIVKTESSPIVVEEAKPVVISPSIPAPAPLPVAAPVIAPAPAEASAPQAESAAPSKPRHEKAPKLTNKPPVVIKVTPSNDSAPLPATAPVVTAPVRTTRIHVNTRRPSTIASENSDLESPAPAIAPVLTAPAAARNDRPETPVVTHKIASASDALTSGLAIPEATREFKRFGNSCSAKVPRGSNSAMSFNTHSSALQQKYASKGLEWGAPVMLRVKKYKDLDHKDSAFFWPSQVEASVYDAYNSPNASTDGGGVVEVWVQSPSGEYKWLDTYDIGFMSGIPGPKRTEGDGQTPEGMYNICADRMHPDHPDYHMSMNLGFGRTESNNAFDRRRGASGGHVLFHGVSHDRYVRDASGQLVPNSAFGKPVSAGCLSLEDERIEELYSITEGAINANQNYCVPVQIFPFDMTEHNLAKWTPAQTADLSRILNKGTLPCSVSDFWANLKEGYDYFETHHRPPQVGVVGDGCNTRYTFNDAPPVQRNACWR